MDPVEALVVERLRCEVGKERDGCDHECRISLLHYVWHVATCTSREKRCLDWWNACSEEIYRMYADSVVINAVVETGCYPYEFWLLSSATQKLMEKKCREHVEVDDDMHVYVFRDHFVLVETDHRATTVFSLDAGKNCRPSYRSYSMADTMLYFGRGKLPKDVEDVLKHYMAFYEVYRFFERGEVAWMIRFTGL
jgi:hypothetical protein